MTSGVAQFVLLLGLVQSSLQDSGSWYVKDFEYRPNHQVFPVADNWTATGIITQQLGDENDRNYISIMAMVEVCSMDLDTCLPFLHDPPTVSDGKASPDSAQCYCHMQYSETNTIHEYGLFVAGGTGLPLQNLSLFATRPSSILGATVTIGDIQPSEEKKKPSDGACANVEKTVDEMKDQLKGNTDTIADLIRENRDLKAQLTEQYTQMQSQLTKENRELQTHINFEHMDMRAHVTKTNEESLDQLTQQYTQMHSQLTNEIANLKTQFTSELESMRSQLSNEIKSMTIQLLSEDENVRLQHSNEIANLKTQFTSEHESMRSQLTKVVKEDQLTKQTSLISELTEKVDDMHDAITVESCLGVRSVEPRPLVRLGNGKLVVCDVVTDGGGWTVIQRRERSNIGFYQRWASYKAGFRDNKDVWLGLDFIHKLTTDNEMELRIDMILKGQRRYAHYKKFKVLGEKELYKLLVSGYSGNAGDSFSAHSGYPFSTRDRDNDNYSGNCGEFHKGGWWFHDCWTSYLNAPFNNMQWGRSRIGSDNPVTFSEMKIRPLSR